MDTVIGKERIAAAGIRWMVKSDMGQVLAIERDCFPFDPWDEKVFARVLQDTKSIGMVTDLSPRQADAENIGGYMVYLYKSNALVLLTIAIHPVYRRAGLGRAMMEKLIGKCSCGLPTRLIADVHEQNLRAQQFFRAVGLKATNVLRGSAGRGRDVFRFSWSRDQAASLNSFDDVLDHGVMVR